MALQFTSRNVSVEGMAATVKALQSAYDVTRARLVDVTVAAKRELAQLTAQAAPFRTGALREAIEPSSRRSLIGFIGIKAGEIRGETPSKYWHMVEFGTVNMAAQPYIVPTAERYGDVYLNRIRRVGQDIERDLQSRGQRFL